MEYVVDVLYDSTAILGAFLAEPSERQICRAALELAEQRTVQGWICGHGICTVADELTLELGAVTAYREVAGLRSFLQLAEVSSTVLDAALLRAAAPGGPALEDAMTIQTAETFERGLIVSLNGPDLTRTSSMVLTPVQLLQQFQSRTGTD
jgi:hypothetical protein